MQKKFIGALGAIVLLGACATGGNLLAASPSKAELSKPTAEQLETFGGLTDYVGKTMKGAPSSASTESFTDYQSWEWALGGKAILIRHALEDGSYGGDTYIYKDAKSGKLTYVYVTNAGFHTVGDMQPVESGWVAEEAVTGHETITRVRSTTLVREDGSTKMTSEYLSNGEWTPGHQFEYALTTEPLPILKSK